MRGALGCGNSSCWGGRVGCAGMGTGGASVARCALGQNVSKTETFWGLAAAGRGATSACGAAFAAAAVPFTWWTTTPLLASPTCTSAGTGATGRSDTSVSSATAGASIRAKFGNFSRNRSKPASSAGAGKIAVAACACAGVSTAFGFGGNGMRAAGDACSTATVATAGTPGAAISPGRAVRGMGRAASASSMRLRARVARPSPIRMRPPTNATIPGVTTPPSNGWAWLAKPAAIMAVPAAVITAPNTNNNAYIYPNPLPVRSAQ